ncbi:MAG: glycerophosphodiester phosphodiesterase family protein [Bacteroidota bacterium]
MIKKFLLVILTILVLATLRFTYPLIYQLFVSQELESTITKPKVVAHRGFSGYTPENTIPAIKKALELGVDIIEIDVHLSKDGIPVILHDFDLDRTTNATGPVINYTFEELRTFRILGADGIPTDETIPSLNEILKLINGQTECTIELKWNDMGYYPGMSEKIVTAIKEANGESWCYVHSYSGKYLEEIHELNPELRLVKAFIGMWHSPIFNFYYDTQFHWGRYYPPQYLYAVLPYYKTLTKSQVNAWQDLNIEVWSYTINEKESMKTQMNLGVDAIVTDYPDRYKELLAD